MFGFALRLPEPKEVRNQTIPKSDASYRATTTSEDDVKAATQPRTTAKDPTLSEVLRG